MSEGDAILADRYRAIAERLLLGDLLDAEVDKLGDEQDRIVKRLRQRHLVRELHYRPWIVVT